MNELLALELTRTIRMTQDGPADTIATPEGLATWIREHAPELSDDLRQEEPVADEDLRRRVVAVRSAVRALFARAVAPSRPSAADAGRLPDPDDALALLNEVAALAPVTPRLDWPVGEAPLVRQVPSAPDPGDRLLAALARAAIGLLGGPLRAQLRTCLAPRCVLYFVKEHGRQEWCSTACGNRARAARHYERHRAGRVR
ncbi:CGNR zinc finger domain-containing protein [Actinoallomurus vinaceus]|uniref:CGNR zinc finger domain-containing protein n=1 Tax=Actinoallomurus vinaceus TaxID=1080074 RepID=A0ABP8UL66_9ACTN